MSHKLIRVAAGLALASALGICASATAISTAAADIISTTGLTIVSPPLTVTGDFIINSGGALPPQLIFAEQQGVTLLNPLVTDTGTIAAGTLVSSYFFAVNAAIPGAIVDTSVTFSSPVLGLIYLDGSTLTAPPVALQSQFRQQRLSRRQRHDLCVGRAKLRPVLWLRASARF